MRGRDLARPDAIDMLYVQFHDSADLTQGQNALAQQLRDIRWQFLTEAALLCLTGGLAGIIIGSGLSHILKMIGGLQSHVSPAFALFALILSVAIGVLAGTWPAVHAARMLPVDALRHD